MSYLKAFTDKLATSLGYASLDTSSKLIDKAQKYNSFIESKYKLIVTDLENKNDNARNSYKSLEKAYATQQAMVNKLTLKNYYLREHYRLRVLLLFYALVGSLSRSFIPLIQSIFQ